MNMALRLLLVTVGVALGVWSCGPAASAQTSPVGQILKLRGRVYLKQTAGAGQALPAAAWAPDSSSSMSPARSGATTSVWT